MDDRARLTVPLHIKIMLVLIACILPVCTVSLLSNQYEQEVIRQTIFETQESNVSFYKAMLEQEIKRLENLAYSYLNDQEFIKLATVSNSLTDYERVELISNVRKKLALIKQISPYVANVFVYMPDIDRSINAVNSDYELSHAEVGFFISEENIAKPIVNFEGRLFARGYYALNRSVRESPIMLMAIELDTSTIAKIMREAAGTGSAVLFTQDWRLDVGARTEVDTGVETARPDLPRTASWLGNGYLFTRMYSSVLDLTMLVYLPQIAVLSRLWMAEHWLWALLVLSIMGLSATAIAAYRIVHIPIRTMVGAFHEVELGNRGKRLSVIRNDEFRYLYMDFNRMMDRISELLGEVRRQGLLFQQAQLKQLQMQINPHFFYNSFFSVRGMLELGDTDAASKMLENIGRYFQFITRSGRDVILLMEELSHARAYLEIQKIRFENITVLLEEPPETIREIKVPRLILQPLIENAYLYGLEDKVGQGRIEIRFFDCAETIRITIRDDGGQMTDEKIEALRKRLDAPNEGETTGILNIHSRLKLFYGSVAGIAVERNEFAGLTLVMTIPKTVGGVALE